AEVETPAGRRSRLAGAQPVFDHEIGQIERILPHRDRISLDRSWSDVERDRVEVHRERGRDRRVGPVAASEARPVLDFRPGRIVEYQPAGDRLDSGETKLVREQPEPFGDEERIAVSHDVEVALEDALLDRSGTRHARAEGVARSEEVERGRRGHQLGYAGRNAGLVREG